jgi:hypothetical protein
MYHVACDAAFLADGCHGANDLGDEYFSAAALELAREAGFHIRADLAICPECWAKGIRYARVSTFGIAVGK